MTPERELQLLDELLAMSRAQRRARGVKAGKLDLIYRRDVLRMTLAARDTASRGNLDRFRTGTGQ